MDFRTLKKKNDVADIKKQYGTL